MASRRLAGEKCDPAHCTIEVALEVIGGMWKVIVVRELLHGTRRYSELFRGVKHATHKMLAQQLRQLEHDGVINRVVYPQVPPKVEYSLTPLGRELGPLLDSMSTWGERVIAGRSRKAGRVRTALTGAAMLAVASVTWAQTPAFRTQEIAAGFGVGYAVAAGDVNGDRRTDILAISGTELVWFEAPTWEKHVILGAGATTADNVTLAPHDIDGDGRLDVALGAGWTGPNTGTLQWVRQNAPGANPAWEVFPIGAESTLHRIKWADVDGDRKPELVVAPLHGKGAKGPAWDGPSARLLVFSPPKKPATEPWPMEVAGEANHIQHNFLVANLDRDRQDELITASKEGVRLWKRAKGGTWTHALIGEGAPGEVKLGRVGKRRMLATVEPWHGAGVAVYAEKPGAAAWAKTTIESGLTQGHALGWADFDGDGSDELAVGWRSGKPGLAIYTVDREGALQSKTLVDDGGLDCEDLVVGDFNGDGKPDIVGSGRATRNIRIYWNETARQPAR
jgi:DNA-binding HxlR family transcriptional regulator